MTGVAVTKVLAALLGRLYSHGLVDGCSCM